MSSKSKIVKRLQPTELQSQMEYCDRISGIRSMLQLLKVFFLWQCRNNEDDDATVQQKLRKFNIFRYMLHAPLSITYTVCLWIEVFMLRDLNSGASVIYMALTEAVFMVKLFNIWHFSTKAWNFINELEMSPDFEFSSIAEIRMWNKEQHNFKVMSILFFVCGLCAVVFGFISVLFLKEYQLPYEYYVPFDWRNAENYWYAYGYNMMSLPVTSISNMALDMLGCYFMFHVSILYKLLGLRMERLKVLGEAEVVKELKAIIRFHKNIRRY